MPPDVSMTSAGALVLFGRSSSVFTRVARMFAAEAGVDYEYRIVRSLMSETPEDYGGNPALRLPVLQTPSGPFFGTLNVCREVVRRSRGSLLVTWPEQLQTSLQCSAQEFVLDGMASEVSLIMSGQPRPQSAASSAQYTTISPTPTPEQSEPPKVRTRLQNILTWLDGNIHAVLAGLPARDTSFLEVTLFCFVTHLEFRSVTETTSLPHLRRFADAFAERNSARLTPYCFDP